MQDAELIHNIEPEYLYTFIMMAMDEVPDIALGVFLQCFGGLRKSEVVSLEYKNISITTVGDIPSVMLLNFAVSYVYIKTKRSILAGALVHMFANLLGSQLLSPYSTEISMTIRYTKMLSCGCLALYCIFSKRFKEEYNELFKCCLGP